MMWVGLSENWVLYTGIPTKLKSLLETVLISNQVWVNLQTDPPT
jgi:hypothetical protein